MPKILTRLTNQLKSRGVKNAKSVAETKLKDFGILNTKGDLTSKGKTRNEMSPGERAKDRAAKYSKTHSPKDYNYNKKTNRARLK